MNEILHACLPDDMIHARALPGVQPVQGAWLHIDDAYAAQMAYRVQLLNSHRDAVLWCDPSAKDAALELLDMVLAELLAFGFAVADEEVQCPDGRSVTIARADPLGTLGRLVQCDFCLLDRKGAEHVLAGAVLCFPASWTLAEKAGRGLVDIHVPVKEYEADLARRVQRLFDGVRIGRPIWRFNQLWYDDPDLHQPRSETAPRVPQSPNPPYFRAERQTILRLPQSNWVVFSIHTYVVHRDHIEFDARKVERVSV